MARQSATQHLGVLEAATSSPRSGGDGKSCTTSTPFLSARSRNAGSRSSTIPSASPQRHQATSRGGCHDRQAALRVRHLHPEHAGASVARTDRRRPDRRLLGARNVSDWQAGSPWEHRRVDGSGIADVIGRVLEAVPPRRLVMTFDAPARAPHEDPQGDLRDRAPPRHRPPHRYPREPGRDDALRRHLAGWPAVLANLKSLLETGHVLPQAPWEMHAELRAAQIARNDLAPRAATGQPRCGLVPGGFLKHWA